MRQWTWARLVSHHSIPVYIERRIDEARIVGLDAVASSRCKIGRIGVGSSPLDRQSRSRSLVGRGHVNGVSGPERLIGGIRRTWIVDVHGDRLMKAFRVP